MKALVETTYFSTYFSPIKKVLADFTEDEKNKRLRYLKFITQHQRALYSSEADYLTVYYTLDGIFDIISRRKNHLILMKYIVTAHNFEVVFQL